MQIALVFFLTKCATRINVNKQYCTICSNWNRPIIITKQERRNIKHDVVALPTLSDSTPNMCNYVYLKPEAIAAVGCNYKSKQFRWQPETKPLHANRKWRNKFNEYISAFNVLLWMLNYFHNIITLLFFETGWHQRATTCANIVWCVYAFFVCRAHGLIYIVRLLLCVVCYLLLLTRFIIAPYTKPAKSKTFYRSEGLIDR